MRSRHQPSYSAVTLAIFAALALLLLFTGCGPVAPPLSSVRSVASYLRFH